MKAIKALWPVGLLLLIPVVSGLLIGLIPVAIDSTQQNNSVRIELLSSVDGKPVRSWKAAGHVYVGYGYAQFMDAETGDDTRIIGNVLVVREK